MQYQAIPCHTLQYHVLGTSQPRRIHTDRPGSRYKQESSTDGRIGGLTDHTTTTNHNHHNHHNRRTRHSTLDIRHSIFNINQTSSSPHRPISSPINHPRASSLRHHHSSPPPPLVHSRHHPSTPNACAPLPPSSPALFTFTPQWCGLLINPSEQSKSTRLSRDSVSRSRSVCFHPLSFFVIL